MHYSSSPGGIEILMPNIVKEMQNYDFKIFVIRPPAEGNINVYESSKTEITYGSRSTLISLFKFYSFCDKNKNAIYHLFNTGPYFLSILKILGIKKIIYSIHGTVYWKTIFQRWMRSPFWRFGINKKIIFTGNSLFSAKVFKEEVCSSAEPILLYNPIDNNKFNPSGKLPTQNPVKIIYVGRLVAGKNLFKWIETAHFLLKKGINATFELYGKGPLKLELEQEVRRLDLESKISFKGHQKDIENVYRNSDVLLMMSSLESFGNVVVESVLCGTPVIAFNIPAMKEIFCDFPEFLIEQNKEFKETIYVKLTHLEELKNRMPLVSKNFASRFGSEVHMNKLNEIYASVV